MTGIKRELRLQVASSGVGVVVASVVGIVISTVVLVLVVVAVVALVLTVVLVVVIALVLVIAIVAITVDLLDVLAVVVAACHVGARPCQTIFWCDGKSCDALTLSITLLHALGRHSGQNRQ